MRTKRWFKNRIGKRIYRDDSGCSCNGCKDIVENGLEIWDEHNHYEYLYDTQNEFANCGVLLNYRDKKYDKKTKA